MIGRGLRLALTVAISLQLSAAVLAEAFNFQEPGDWNVGDAGSTFQRWTPMFASSDTVPTGHAVNPTLSTSSGMGVQSPGFVAGSGGYYSFTDNYEIYADIYNHGGSAATTADYLTGYGTRVIVQTAATTNVDFDTSVFQDTIELVKLDGTPLAGGANADLVGVTELFRQEVATPFGPADQQEVRFEFYLPKYSSDFRVRFQTAVHSSFQEMRIDTLLVEEVATLPGDFDGDGDVDGDDLADWQGGYGQGNTGDADGDGDTDGRDFLVWQQNYTGPGELVAVSAVPEPTSLMVMIFGIITRLGRRPTHLLSV